MSLHSGHTAATQQPHSSSPCISLNPFFPSPLLLGSLVSRRRCTRGATEGHLDKYLPALFTRAVDPKQPLREQACDLLGLLQATFPREAVLAAAERAVERHRVAKAKARAVEFGNEIVQAAALGAVDNGTGTALMLSMLLKPDSTADPSAPSVTKLLHLLDSHHTYALSHARVISVQRC